MNPELTKCNRIKWQSIYNALFECSARILLLNEEMFSKQANLKVFLVKFLMLIIMFLPPYFLEHEEKRLIRVWISPGGSHINLEILEVPLFRIPVRFVENEWTHVCQSWSSNHAAWSLYLNGKLKASGNALKVSFAHSRCRYTILFTK